MTGDKKLNPYIRLVFFFALFAISIGDAFNVLFIRDMAAEFAPEGKLDIYTSIPVTMMIVGVCSSEYIAKVSKSFSSFLITAIIFSGAGMIVRGLATHYIVMLIGFMAVGFGYGCFYIGIRYYAYLFADEKDQMETLAMISGGAFAGQCMGCVLGGIMAGQMAYRTVYLFAVLLMIPALVLCIKHKVNAHITTGGLARSLKNLRRPRVLMYLILMVVPMFACTVFTSYTVPLETDAFGYSATMISALLLGASMLSAYAGPFMTGFFTTNMQPKSATYIYCIAISFLIAVFELGNSFPLLVLVVLLIGLMDSFGPNVMTGAFTQITGNSDGAKGEGLILFILFTRIGMTIAPSVILLFGSSLALSGMVITGLALFMLLGTIANIITEKRGTNEKSDKI